MNDIDLFKASDQQYRQMIKQFETKRQKKLDILEEESASNISMNLLKWNSKQLTHVSNILQKISDSNRPSEIPNLSKFQNQHITSHPLKKSNSSSESIEENIQSNVSSLSKSLSLLNGLPLPGEISR